MAKSELEFMVAIGHAKHQSFQKTTQRVVKASSVTAAKKKAQEIFEEHQKSPLSQGEDTVKVYHLKEI